ncbi:FHA domain-containing protein [Nocardioides aequoreus]|uniref:FHA domain-containing protein n=1 Tax=Nocardioides aequoreus TaxID=397278 RepID=UPI000564975A|nr:FHA domain-containing protein [Nocardioides aequoreus]
MSTSPDSRQPTTTHDPDHGGAPRLALEQEYYLPGERQVVWYVEGDVVTIGSSDGCDVVLPGLAPLHATLSRDDRDELVLRSEGAETRVHGAPVRAQLLRSGARIELGDHVLAYYRDEHADHGRPYGGRVGGEIGHQRPQPPRPEDR